MKTVNLRIDREVVIGDGKGEYFERPPVLRKLYLPRFAEVLTLEYHDFPLQENIVDRSDHVWPLLQFQIGSVYHGANCDAEVLQSPTQRLAASFSGRGDLTLTGRVDASQLGHHPVSWARRMWPHRSACRLVVVASGHVSESCSFQMHLLLEVVILMNMQRAEAPWALLSVSDLNLHLTT